jgi:GNAT superfamily N-acetyltransferase
MAAGPPSEQSAHAGFAVEFQSASSPSEGSATLLIGCGGWSRRRTLYGGDAWRAREDSRLDPRQDAAKIRAFFVHPQWARHGIGSRILEICESAAIAAGFTRFEMGATLTGVPLYQARRYVVLEPISIPLANGEALPIIHMEKRLSISL